MALSRTYLSSMQDSGPALTDLERLEMLRDLRKDQLRLARSWKKHENPIFYKMHAQVACKIHQDIKTLQREIVLAHVDELMGEEPLTIELKLASEMGIDERVACLLAEWVAVDKNYKTTDEKQPARLSRSNGRRKSGRPTKYYLQGIGQLNAVIIEAYSDDEALQEANARLSN